ncbi:MAG: sulfatase [Lentisphaerae bacterium]|jgi:arylsulfatase A-like enzyme|nr:sulfatase [Lentisphaerota bacterium]MBT4820327.1 sulfatase [Lentisphaerota bacterium]MBT5609322.1 sulfatase [Lentisphaerota bacterium]MBT7060826.1 sulfatase [Lentisphaerota bacterium]MBT7846729.1 sulfatase [Lentisphaerota bacterium]
MSHPRPNIVYVMADQLRYQSCGYAGDERARTPNIDRLATEGVSFSNAVVSMPVCSAYRASLMTGKYTTSTGMVINEIRISPEHHPRCLAHCLGDAGYELGYIGKWHLWANQLGNHHDPANSFTPPGPHRLGFDGYWAAYNFHHQYYGEVAYYHTGTPARNTFAEGTYEPDGQTGLAIDYIREHAAGEHPFALFLSLGTPHDPWTRSNVPEEYYSLFSDVTFAPPENYLQENDVPYGDAWSDIDKDPARISEWMRVYYAMTANLDANVGRVLAALEKCGLDQDTLVVFTSDHGECFGAHGRMKKNIFYEEAARVPFLMKLPGVIPAGFRHYACFNCVDIMPTLLGFAGGNIPEEAEGMDLSHCARGEAGPEPAFAFLQNTGACAAWEDGHEWRAVRDKQFTYAVYRVDGRELLFDNLADPLQMTDLAGSAAHGAVLQTFREKLSAKMDELGDHFDVSSYYRANWVSEDRLITRTAHG